MASYNKFLSALKEALGTLINDGWSDYKKAATSDSKAFLAKAKTDLERWTKLLAEGKLTEKDFAWLVKGKKDLAELEALTQAGIAAARLARFRKTLLDTVVSTAIAIFL
jgi:hypothetical protein